MTDRDVSLLLLYIGYSYSLSLSSLLSLHLFHVSRHCPLLRFVLYLAFFLSRFLFFPIQPLRLALGCLPLSHQRAWPFTSWSGAARNGRIRLKRVTIAHTAEERLHLRFLLLPTCLPFPLPSVFALYLRISLLLCRAFARISLSSFISYTHSFIHSQSIKENGLIN